MSSLFDWAKNFKKDERGNIAIIFAMVSTISVGIVGGAVDVGRVLTERVRLQAAVDAAAIAGARAIAQEAADPTGVARSLFAANVPGVVPTVTQTGEAININAGMSVKTTLLAVMGISELPISVRAQAEPAWEEVLDPEPESGNVCILLLDPSKSRSFWASGNQSVQAPDCEVHVHSAHSTESVFINTGKDLNVKKSCTVGGANLVGGGGGNVGPVEESCNVAGDTYAGTLPVPLIEACKSKPNLNKATVALTPGTFCGDWEFKGKVKNITLEPGVYVFNNARWKFNAKLSGTGVTIYYADGNSYLNFNGQAEMDIQAPEYGTYKGILIYESSNISNLTTNIINGGTDAVIKGLVYLPSRDMKWNGNSGLESDQLTMVLNSLTLLGTTT